MNERLKLLVIDDVEADFRLIERHLRVQGLMAECHWAASADELGSQFEAGHDWDAVLVDYQMPGMNFAEVLRQVQTSMTGVPIILVSGSIGEEAAVDLLKQGVRDVVLKDRLARLVPAITRSLAEVAEQRARRLAEARLELAVTAFENTTEGIFVTDAENRIVSVNRAFSEITGHGEDDLMGKDPCVLRCDRHDRGFFRALWTSLRNTGTWRGEIWNRRKNGDVFPAWLNISVVRDSAARITHYVGVLADISEHKAARERIEYLAHHDPLTGLPNRALLSDRIQQAIMQADRSGHGMAVLFLDLDRFKNINDSLGHAVGDEVLCVVAGRLQACVRGTDTVARLGGDEFVLVLTETDNVEGIVRVIASINAAVSQPVRIEGQSMRLTSSIGVCLYPRDGRDGAALLKNADNAMYHAKSDGRDTYRFFAADMDTRAHERFRTEVELRDALERDEFRVYFQPLFNSRTGQLKGAEALLRWLHPQRGLLTPAAFLGVAEDAGLIIPIGDWVLKQAFRQCKAWHVAGHRLSVAVNLSARQFREPGLLEAVQDVLVATELPAEYLELEITERMLVEPTEQTLAILHALHALRVRLSVDDFGTGYSSLNYLKRYPISVLKIDKSFVDDIATSGHDRAIAEAIIALARALDLETIAEGAEQEAQVRVLREIGCDTLQGYYFGKPVPAEEFLVFAV